MVAVVQAVTELGIFELESITALEARDGGLAMSVCVAANVVEVEGTIEDSEVRLIADVAEDETIIVDVVEGVLEGLLVVEGTAMVEELAQIPPGTLSVCPASSKSQMTWGFAALRESKDTSKLFAIFCPLSP